MMIKILLTLILMTGTCLAGPRFTSSRNAPETRRPIGYEKPHYLGLASPKQGLLRVAEQKLGESTSGIPGTSGGRLACAAVVSDIFADAGIPITTRSTAEMAQKLPRAGFSRVSTSNARPGDVILSPTQGDNHGHVGIVGRDGKIYSNNSRSARFAATFTLSSWQAYYGGRKGLPVQVWRN